MRLVGGTDRLNDRLITQIKAVVLTLVLSGGVSAVLFYGIKKLVGLRVDKRIEEEGLDIYEHGESAYN